MITQDFKKNTYELIDSLKAVCAEYGLGNDGNEYKIITQVFLYKFLNDKLAFEVKRIMPELKEVANWEDILVALSDNEYDMLQLQMDADTARLQPQHFISYLFERQNTENFAKLFDETLMDIAVLNNDIFAVKTAGGAKIILFDPISNYITDPSERDNFCRAIINKLIGFSFERVFNQKYDFYATIFEYLIKDYNKDNGGKYAEYYTPHAVAKIMAAILVPESERGKIANVACYDPSAGSGTLLMSLAHAIGEKRCSIFSQDISQKSSSLLRLNLILNNLVHSIPNVIKGNTLLTPYHKQGNDLRKFDYIVSNPPFKMDFSDSRNNLDAKEHKERFFAGVPNVPAKAKDKMAVYQLFLQHIIYSLKANGKAAVVVPTGFITPQKSGIGRKIIQHLVENKMLAGVVSMPSNIFATTGTNVSILFIDANNKDNVVLIDASNLGTKVKEDKNQKTLLSEAEEQYIVETFNTKKAIDNFSVVISYDDIANKNYSLSAGQYFDVKISYSEMSHKDFQKKINKYSTNLVKLTNENNRLHEEIIIAMGNLKYDI